MVSTAKTHGRCSCLNASTILSLSVLKKALGGDRYGSGVMVVVVLVGVHGYPFIVSLRIWTEKLQTGKKET